MPTVTTMENCGMCDDCGTCVEVVMVNTKALVIAIATLVMLAGTCCAQVAPGNQMTPQQMQAIINMRALQMRGGGQVRTGYRQDIQFGAPQQQNYAQQEEQANQDRKAATQKRIEARKAREEKKKAARDDAKAKKGKAAPKGKDELANAKDAKKPITSKTSKSAKKADEAKSAKGSKKPADDDAAK